MRTHVRMYSTHVRTHTKNVRTHVRTHAYARAYVRAYAHAYACVRTRYFPFEPVNPYTMIKKIVERYHYGKDVQRAEKSNCVYTSLTIFDSCGEYKIDERLTRIGQFRNSELRRIFLHAFLYTCGYTKECKHCGERVTDLTEHCLSECKAMEQRRSRFKLLMLFYNSPEGTKLEHKDTVFKLALPNHIT